jgi:Formyl transferase
MRIVFFTNAKEETSGTFLYMFAQVAAVFPDVHLVTLRRELDGPLARYLKELKRIWHFAGGLASTLEIISSYPLKQLMIERDDREAQAGMRLLNRPPVTPRRGATIYVSTANGPDAVEAISGLEPDVLIQLGNGILSKQIFEIARIGTLNLHPGIAPLNKGREPIYWALWEQEPSWLGATVHFIDEGIDTGPVLAYAPVEQRFPGERYPPLYVRTYKLGVKCLVDTLLRLARGERWTIDPPSGASEYRSSISGWKMAAVEIRGALRRWRLKGR